MAKHVFDVARLSRGEIACVRSETFGATMKSGIELNFHKGPLKLGIVNMPRDDYLTTLHTNALARLANELATVRCVRISEGSLKLITAFDSMH